MIDLKFSKAHITQEFNGDFNIILTIPKDQRNVIETLNELLTDDKPKVCKIDHYKKKRSLNANNYMWQLVTQIADKLRTSKDEVYLSMLKRYGQSSVVSVVDEAVPMFMKSVQYAEEFGKGIVNGKNFTHIKVFVGSSSYDSREMSILIDGVVSEAEGLGIVTMTPNEIQRLKDNWKGEV
jgi:hypothetical protein